MPLARLFVLTALVALPASAADTLSDEAIRDLVSGNTVTGSMSGSGGYAEYYAEDGTIRAEDYEGEWSIEGERMCFAYGGEATCYAVAREGDAVT
ncbi:MAG: hypothetical protein ACFBWO_14195 [Paracoccaceae bacterium]